MNHQKLKSITHFSRLNRYKKSKGCLWILYYVLSEKNAAKGLPLETKNTHKNEILCLFI